MFLDSKFFRNYELSKGDYYYEGSKGSERFILS